MLETLREIRAQCGPEQRRPFVRGGYSSPVGWGVLELGGEDPFRREKISLFFSWETSCVTWHLRGREEKGARIKHGCGAGVCGVGPL